ncbi:CG3078 [Drosophila busckii]|uniref:CG3078 n=1 Tax=Drosophila busckii TaxID=30019 RepID=A0A0M4EZE2_DROBS|nr:protein unc-93 homolog A [Drosophila busckii]ALC49530.1 CG3078 [Drosophila busckii]
MGSLPNLHELEEVERRREKRREYALLLEERARDTSRERERLSLFAQQRKQSYNNAQAIAGLGVGGLGVNVGGGSLSSTVTNAVNILDHDQAAATSSTRARHQQHQQQQQQQQQQHGHLHQHSHIQRGSLPSRNRVNRPRARSSTITHYLWDDGLMEHMGNYTPSPVSTRSYRINPVSSVQVQAALSNSRRRDSINSSIGANSVNRLITLNRTCHNRVPGHIRRLVSHRFTCMCIAHSLMCAVLLPIMALQGSSSVWHHREQWLHIGPNIGSLLLSVLFLVSAATSIPSLRLIHRYGYTPLLTANYLCLFLFVLSHLYTSIYTLLPAYMLLGLTLSGATNCKAALLVYYGARLSCMQSECTALGSAASSVPLEALEEHKMFCDRDQKVRRLARWYRASQDVGIIMGAIFASLLLACNENDWNCITYYLPYFPVHPNASSRMIPAEDYYNRNDRKMRICGAAMCPFRLPQLNEPHHFQERDDTFYDLNLGAGTFFKEFIAAGSQSAGHLLLWFDVMLALISLSLSLISGRTSLATGVRLERIIQDISNTRKLFFAGPLAFYIGAEQGFMSADFMRAFISCSIGINLISGSLIGMGAMQLVVSCTLSMLLRHTKRIVVILAAFFFQSCLLLALSTWKPAKDDSALFFVIAASWGACNGMWETLLLSLVTQNHAQHENALSITASLQTLRFVGLGLSFMAHGFICEKVKIIALMVLLIVCVLPYAILEVRLDAQRKATLHSL